ALPISGRIGAPSRPRPGLIRRPCAVRAHTTQARAKEHHVATLPSVSYSITVRLELDAGGTAVGSLTNAVERAGGMITALDVAAAGHRSEEHTSELQSRFDLVCRLLLEKKNTT